MICRIYRLEYNMHSILCNILTCGAAAPREGMGNAIYIYIYVYMYLCMHVWIYVCMYVCMCVCMSVCMYVCMYAYAFCMYAYTHIQMLDRLLVHSNCVSGPKPVQNRPPAQKRGWGVCLAADYRILES